MSSRWRLVWLVIAFGAGLIGCNKESSIKMKNIEFDVGVPMEQVSQLLGPNSQKQVVGATTSALGFFRSGAVEGTFARGPFSVRLGKLFSMTAYSSSEVADGRVNNLDITVDADDFSSHAQALAGTANLIAQFQRGKWKRYIPETCPWVTGRSTMMSATGQVDIGACPLDPALVFTAQEWPNLAAQKLRWQWVGDGRVATLEVQYAYNKPDVPTYTVNLQFELEEAVKFYAAKGLQEMKAEFGEGKVTAGAARGAAEIRLLEEAALKRGDRVIPRP